MCLTELGVVSVQNVPHGLMCSVLGSQLRTLSGDTMEISEGGA